jgi:hypothetical protein
MPGLGNTFPPGLSRRVGPQRAIDSTSQPSAAEENEAERFAAAIEEYVSKKNAWDQEVENEARVRYQQAMAVARHQAIERAGFATDVDLSVLRGRGAEFVLEFTTVVVIIFAAVVLGVLDILGTEQIGTLLAAIAGYVLGRATTRARSTTEAKTVPEAPGAAAPQRQGTNAGAQQTIV